jgi:Na+/proline symporter
LANANLCIIQVFTTPEYLRKRFGRERLRIIYSVLTLLLHVFTKISVDLYASGLFIEQALKWNFYACIAVLLTIAAVCTITGFEIKYFKRYFLA